MIKRNSVPKGLWPLKCFEKTPNYSDGVLHGNTWMGGIGWKSPKVLKKSHENLWNQRKRQTEWRRPAIRNKWAAVIIALSRSEPDVISSCRAIIIHHLQ